MNDPVEITVKVCPKSRTSVVNIFERLSAQSEFMLSDNTVWTYHILNKRHIGKVTEVAWCH